MFVRPEIPGDRVDVRTVHTAAFGRSAEADLVDSLRATEGWLPSLSLVAEQDGTIVGHVLFSDVLLAGRPVLSLAPLGVHPDHQRAGIGSALVRTGLAIAERTDRGLVVVLGNPAYYGRFGFLASGAQGVIDPFQGPDGHFQLRRLPGYKAGLIGTVIYPPVFASL
ncbi:MAG TPA: N-acetyltransferase [Mycobacteriales bacterium]|jgi:putative acetyltransferase